jgi:hypothetical protein
MQPPLLDSPAPAHWRFCAPAQASCDKCVSQELSGASIISSTDKGTPV